MTGRGGTAGRGQRALRCCSGQRHGRCSGRLAADGAAGWLLLPALPTLPRVPPVRRGGPAGPGGAATRCRSSCSGSTRGAPRRADTEKDAPDGESRAGGRGPGPRGMSRRVAKTEQGRRWETPPGRPGRGPEGTEEPGHRRLRARRRALLLPRGGAAELPRAVRAREALAELPFHSCPVECSRSTKGSLALIISQLTKYVKNAFVQKADFNNKHFLDITTAFT